MKNRLHTAHSPYLRQHADNPVDWFPWGQEALATAQRLDKPILLSIGYSACHWCHVMAHESFEDPQTAAQQNRDFVNIKVDREEHPEVDQIYQHALQLFGQGGGWPLTMFLLPTGEPFYGGTYFPPHDRYGRPSFRRVLSAIHEAFAQRREQLVGQAGEILAALLEVESQGPQPAGQPSAPPPSLLTRCVQSIAARMDPVHGGLSGTPKFPCATALGLFFRAYGRGGAVSDAAPALLTLRKMALGGIYDHLGGGFARYSTDAVWLVPHFEKMLYDNAQLLRLYAQAHAICLVIGDEPLAQRCKAVLAQTHTWLERELRDESGGLYAAQDADSEGVEGKYFVWTPAEVDAALPAPQADVLKRCLDVRAGGNWQDPHGHGPMGTSILHETDEARTRQEDQLLHEAKQRLLEVRQTRVPPGTDDKILCAWNGLAISGLAEAGRLLANPVYVAAAQRTAHALQQHLRNPAGDLCRTYKAGVARLPATLDDYASLAEGFFHLAHATLNLQYLDELRRLTDEAIAHFYDASRRLLYLGPKTSEGVSLVVRPVSLYDSAVPSGLSTMCHNLLRLASLTVPSERQRYIQLAESLLLPHVERMQKSPIGLAHLIAAMDLYQHDLTQVLILDPALDRSPRALSAQGQALASQSQTTYLPDHLTIAVGFSDPLPPWLDHLRLGKTPHAASQQTPLAYVCKGQRCSLPITEPSALLHALSLNHIDPSNPTV